MAKAKDDKKDQKVEETEEKKVEEISAESVNDLLKEELEKLRAQQQELKDTNLRQLAELENTRKRLHKEREEMTRYAIGRFAEDFLAPLDQMEKALDCADNMSEEVKNWAIGFKMILNQFHDVFANNNISSYSAMGEEFNPHLHEAVEADETTDKPEGTILEEYAKGYKMGDYIVRPARVKVAKKATSSPNEELNENQQKGVENDG